MNNYIKNTNEDEFYQIYKSLHVTYYGWPDLPQGLWIFAVQINFLTKWYKCFSAKLNLAASIAAKINEKISSGNVSMVCGSSQEMKIVCVWWSVVNRGWSNYYTGAV
jgi:hypothetical protein